MVYNKVRKVICNTGSTGLVCLAPISYHTINAHLAQCLKQGSRLTCSRRDNCGDHRNTVFIQPLNHVDLCASGDSLFRFLEG